MTLSLHPCQRKRKTKKTKSKPCTAVVPKDSNDNQDIQIATTNDNKENNFLTQNVMQNYRQNLIGMFVSSNLTNCTINIKMPK